VKGNRRRSSSDPNRAWNQTHDATGALRASDNISRLPEVTEGVATQEPSSQNLAVPGGETGGMMGMGRRLSAASSLMRFPSFRPSSVDNEKEKFTEPDEQQNQYNTDLIDLLDTVGMPNPGSMDIEANLTLNRSRDIDS
jgi:hypothetical protein